MGKNKDALTMTAFGRLRGPDGRFVPVQPAATEAQERSDASGTTAGLAGEALRPAQCGVYLRRELASWFPAIVKGFVTQAASGSVPHFKLTNELLQEQAGPKKRKGSAQRLLEELDRMNRESAGTPDAAAAQGEDAWRD